MMRAALVAGRLRKLSDHKLVSFLAMTGSEASSPSAQRYERCAERRVISKKVRSVVHIRDSIVVVVDTNTTAFFCGQHGSVASTEQGPQGLAKRCECCAQVPWWSTKGGKPFTFGTRELLVRDALVACRLK